MAFPASGFHRLSALKRTTFGWFTLARSLFGGKRLNYDWDGTRRNWRMLALAALVVLVAAACGLTAIAGLAQ
jgi:hypothetical protein